MRDASLQAATSAPDRDESFIRLAANAALQSSSGLLFAIGDW